MPLLLLLLCVLGFGCSAPAGPDARATLTLFEGLPNQNFEADLLTKEKATKPTTQLIGFDFYKAPTPLKAADVATLRSLLSASALYGGYTEDKKCGGFHPDYALQWGDVTLLICFGCGEIERSEGAKTTRYDMGSDQSKELKTLLKAYRKNRPI